MSQCLIDVIIPIYNRERYIGELVQTLERQTLRNFRAIFVDDGSQDRSYDVLREQLCNVSFASLLLHQENGGAAAARNTGLRHAEADWVVFMDSDDGALPQHLEYLYRAVRETGAEIGFCYFQTIPDASRDAAKPTTELCAEEISPEACMRLHYTNWFHPCCMIMSRKLQQRQQLFFDQECTYCEDAPFLTEVIEAADRVAEVKNELYLYYTHQGSLSRSATAEKFLIGLEGFFRMKARMDSKSSKAAKAFKTMGTARYLIAILRRSAAQMPYEEFVRVTQAAPLSTYKEQIPNMPLAQRAACYLYLCSKRLFYVCTHRMFHD